MAAKINLLPEPTQLDVVAPEIVEIVIRDDGTVAWINVDGICRLRTCRVGRLRLVDLRKRERLMTRRDS